MAKIKFAFMEKTENALPPAGHVTGRISANGSRIANS
jgi:hypothetical protein